MRHIVGVSDMKVSGSPDDLIVTHALGSCIGIVIFDARAGVGGILHYMLPSSSVDRQKAESRPYMFGDTGIPMLFEAAYELGAKKDNIRVVMAGGAQVFRERDHFDIGKRNIVIARKLFWKNRLLIDAEDVGGHIPRTLYLDLSSGETWFTSHGEKYQL